MTKKKQVKTVTANAATSKPEAKKNEAVKIEAPKPASKKQIILNLLDEGATVKQIMDATGWQRHTVFGNISNLKKKMSLNIGVEKSGADNIYKIIPLPQ